MYVLGYRKSQTKNEFNIFAEKFDEVLQKINAEKPYSIVICGDFNAHLQEWCASDRDDIYGITIQKIFNENGILQLVNQPTYITNNSKTCIDLVATDQPNLILSSEIHPSLHTTCHHQVNFVKLHLKCPPPPPFVRRVWHYDRANPSLIQRAISDYNWVEELGRASNPDQQVELFDNVILNVAKNVIPFDDKIFKPKDPPWITQSSKLLYNTYRRKYKRFIKKGCPADEKPHIDELKNEYSNLIETEKEKYMSSLGEAVSNPQTGPKKYWSAMKNLLKKNITSVIPPILQNGTFITDSAEKCSIFNQYFKNQCKTIPTSSTLPNLIRSSNLSLKSIIFSEKEILEHIRKLNINKAHGHDAISVRMIKLCDKSIIKPLFIIFKNCLDKGYFPLKWKKANVIPVYKKNERNLVANHRPVSLLPICGKIFEKVIFDNLYCYIFDNNFITDKQSGFKQHDSTIKQLLSITHEIYKAFDSTPSQEIRAVFLDISRAFDRVWHDGLIFKLKRIGIDDEVINILSSFLANRQQRVTIDGKCSEWSDIEAGVPQGSILGPILFLVYINDIIEVVKSDIRIFADDTFIFRVADHNSTDELNNDLCRITKWAHQWKMVFNPDITKQAVEVIFSNKRNKETIPDQLFFNNIPVKTVSETKHLGMILEQKLSFENHLNEKISKANQGLGLMKQLKKWVSFKTLEVIYKMYVRPHLDYGDMIYDIGETEKNGILPTGISSSLLRKVESVQYEAAKIVSGAWQGTSREKLYENLGWESLQNRRIMRKLCLVHEILNTKFPDYLHKILKNQSYPITSRFHNRELLKEIPCRNSKFKLSFFPSTIKDWNILDSETKKSKSTNIFKNKILNKIRPKKKSYFGLKDNDKIKYLTMLRMSLSPLRAHKFKYNFIDTSDPYCIVCESPEDTKHYLLHCRSFRLSRTTLMQNISNLLNLDFTTIPQKKIIAILLYGNDESNCEINTHILEEVTTFIANSKRLDTF